jgi:hypothetical protein
MRKNVYLVLLLVVVLSLGLWTASPAKNAAAQPAVRDTPPCREAADQLVGRSAELPRIDNLIRELCDFNVRLKDVPSNVSEFDKDFVEDSITGNTLELQSLLFAVDRVTNEEWRSQIRMMIIMHTSDLQMALQVAEKIGADTDPDLTHASVYPETPDYDLGKRFENLVEEYLDPLMAGAPEAPGGTPTEVPTQPPTEAPTEPPTATEVPTEPPTATEAPTMVSPGDNTASDFDIRSLNIIEDEHVADVQAELAAERLVKNEELKAFAKHSADVTELHLILMGDLKHRLVDNYTPPEPEFQADYQSPRQFEPK